MARAITMEKDLPPYAAETVQRVKALGFGWRFVEAYPLADKRVQVRNIESLAPPGEVSRYAQSLRRGDQMPPVIVTTDKWLVDGNTRTEAARKLGWGAFPTIIIEVTYDSAPDSVRRQVKILGGGFNNTHGRAMNARNLAELIEQLTRDEEKPSELAKELHLPSSMTATFVNAVKATRRANTLGVNVTGVLSNSHLKLFGGKSERYTSPVFAAMFNLVQDARLTIPQTTDLMKRVDRTETEAERMKLLREARDNNAEAIRMFRGQSETIHRSPSRSGKLRQYLGYLVNTDADKLVEQNSAEGAHHLVYLQDAREKLDKVISEQMLVNASRSER
jgi:hypothetical protein